MSDHNFVVLGNSVPAAQLPTQSEIESNLKLAVLSAASNTVTNFDRTTPVTKPLGFTKETSDALITWLNVNHHACIRPQATTIDTLQGFISLMQQHA